MALARTAPDIFEEAQQKKETTTKKQTVKDGPVDLIPTATESSAETMIARAIDKGVSVETMERLLDMRRELKAEFARQAYNEAMAAFQADCPVIEKTKQVKLKSGTVAYRYAPIESIVLQVKGLLQKYGFSYSTSMELTERGVKATCKVTHAAGHSEKSEMEVPLGTKTDLMSQSQVVAAAQTFAKRYAFCNAFGIMTGDEDNDASPVSYKVSYQTDDENERPAPVNVAGASFAQFDPKIEKFPFGKYKIEDATWLEVPTDYLEWVIANVGNADFRAKAEATLKYRIMIQKQVPDPFDGVFDKPKIEPQEQPKTEPVPEPIEILEHSLDEVARKHDLDLLSGWWQVNHKDIQKLSKQGQVHITRIFAQAKKQAQKVKT